MSKYVFVGRVKDTNDRDCCFYVEDYLHKDICDNIILQGACYCGFYEEKLRAAEEGNVESYLTQEELIDFLYGNNYDFYINKLQSEEAQEFQNKIIEEEKEWVMNYYDISKEDVDCIFNEYYLDYQDRGIVSYIYEDKYELGEEEITNCGYLNSLPDEVAQFFDFEGYGDHLVNYGDSYIELPSGKCASLNY